MFYLQEEFKPMIDESGIVNRYIISNYGRVYDIKNDCFVSQVLTGKPQYFYVNYTNDEGKRKLRRVHNLLARTWITNDNPAQYCMVDHIDKNKYNNCIDNLRWTDRAGNANNMSSNIKVGNSVLTSYCRDKYKDNYLAAVSYISRIMKEQDISSEQAITIYDNYLYNLSTQHALFIEHEGKLYTATQLLKLYGRTDKWLADVKLRYPAKTFKELLTIPFIRINKYNINGEIKTRKEWCLQFNLNPKLVGSRMSQKHLDFKSVLESYGIDTSNMTVLPLT